jgi:hypothetical protein
VLSATAYWIAFVVESALCAIVAVRAARAGTPRHFALAWGSLFIVLAGAGYADWAAQPTKETSLSSYLLGAFLTPLIALTVVWMLRRRASTAIQWLAASASAFVVTVGVVIVAYAIGF